MIESEVERTKRGSFARIWCEREAANPGLNGRWVQGSTSYNRRKGTLRGMHWQAPPHAESKLFRCVAGSLPDVIIDLRADSPTYGEHLAVELSVENRRMLHIPGGFAHGFQTLEDHTNVDCWMSAFYVPDSGRGVRWDDPAFATRWPIGDPILLERDRSYPDFDLANPTWVRA